MAGNLAKLALEDGTIYTGRSFGATGEMTGEVVFNTSMAGYQETLTDPSYKGQIVCMTYPMMGNYGITIEDDESAHPQVSGFLVRSLTEIPSNFRSQSSLHDYLARFNIIGIEGFDTRALVRRLRSRGAMMGIISTVDLDDQSLVRRARSLPGMAGQDLVKDVVPKLATDWRGGIDHPLQTDMLAAEAGHKRVIALDFGMKWNIPRCLTQVGCQVTIVPGTMSAQEILAQKPDGIFLSNGPGDPAAVEYAVKTIRELMGPTPMFGICLGHQLLGLATGAQTFKLKFGHRGANQPVLDSRTGRVEITTQNHGFAVDVNTLPASMESTHTNLNDGTLEGMRHREYPIFSVQYHPEASAGPHDSTYLFSEFRKSMG